MIFTRKVPLTVLMEELPAEQVDWLAVSWGEHPYEDFLPTMQLETSGGDTQVTLTLGLKDEELGFDGWLNKKHRSHFRGNFEERHEEVGQALFYTHLCIESLLDVLQEECLREAPGSDVNLLTQESRALNWLQTSLRVLVAALESCEKDPTKLIQAKLFMGSGADAQRPLLRLVIFNLDISLAFSDDGVAGLVVFDDKNRRDSQHPVLEARFHTLKPPVLDELIKVLAQLMRALEARWLD